MKSFKINKTILWLNIIIFILLLIFTFNEINRASKTHTILLFIMLCISLYMVISSIVRKVVITDDEIIVKQLFKSSSININNINYGYTISAIGRYGLLLSDGHNVVMITSLIDGFFEILESLLNKIPNESKEKFHVINNSTLKRKYITYAFILTLVSAMILYGIIKSYNIF